jgi:TonB family protein
VLKRDPTVSFEIDDSGTVINFKFVEHAGYKDLDDAVEKAIQQWKYAPTAGCGTRSVEVVVLIHPL